MVEVHCKQCNIVFSAREADIKRGWAKFCSKSCKAKKQSSSRRYSYSPKKVMEDEDREDDSWVTSGDDWESCGYHNN